MSETSFRSACNGEVRLQSLACDEGFFLQRSRHSGEGTRRRRASCDRDFNRRHEAQHFIHVSEAGLRLWRVLSAQEVRALNYRAKELDLSLPLFDAILPSNDKHRNEPSGWCSIPARG